MRSKICNIDKIRNFLDGIDDQVKEFIEYQNEILLEIKEEYSLLDEVIEKIETLHLEKFRERYELPF